MTSHVVFTVPSLFHARVGLVKVPAGIHNPPVLLGTALLRWGTEIRKTNFSLRRSSIPGTFRFSQRGFPDSS